MIVLKTVTNPDDPSRSIDVPMEPTEEAAFLAEQEACAAQIAEKRRQREAAAQSVK